MTDLSEKQQQEIRRALEHNRSQIIEKAMRQRRNLATVTDTTGQLSDEYDVATHLSFELLSTRLHDRERRLLRKIDGALTRLANGDYGCCEICDEFIGLARLKARPTATVCIDCKEEQENEERTLQKRHHPPRSEKRTTKQNDERAKRVRSSVRDDWNAGQWLSESDLSLLSHVDTADETKRRAVKSPANTNNAS